MVRSDASRSTQISGFINQRVGTGILISRVTGLPIITKVTGSLTSRATFDAGPVVNLGVGYRLPLGFRIEGDIIYAHYSADSIDPLSTDGTFPAFNGSRLTLQSGGTRDQYEATVNGFYDLPVAWSLVPYFGAGFGMAHVAAANALFAGPGGFPALTQRGGNATDPAIGLEVGVSFMLDATWAVVTSYRFEHLFVTGDDLDYNASVFKLGLRYSF